MKRPFLLVSVIVLCCLVVGIGYRFSPLANSTGYLRIFVRQDARGYRAILENRGVLPVVVGRCETISDAQQKDVTVGDMIQRSTGESWQDVVPRHNCWADGTAEFKNKLLWPTQQLHSSWFFPSVGFPGSPFRHKDKLRFVLFTGPPKQYSDGIPGPEFVIE